MLTAGCLVLEDKGLDIRPPELTYANVFAWIEETKGITLHRSQVHGRIWDRQDDFRMDVLAAAIESPDVGYVATDEALDAIVDAVDFSAGPDLEQLKHTLLRVGMEANIRGCSNPIFDTFLAAEVFAQRLTEPVGAHPLDRPIQQNLADRAEASDRRLRALAELVDIGPDPSTGLSDEEAIALVVRASSGLAEGVGFLAAIDSDVFDPVTVQRSDGTCEEWDLAALGLRLVVDDLFMPTGEDAVDQ